MTLLSSFSLCFASGEKGLVTVTLEDNEKNNITGVTVHLCHIAKIGDNGYLPVPSFENSGISVSAIANNPSRSAAESLLNYVNQNKIDSLSVITDNNGVASFSDLDLGIWLVYCDENSQYAFNPYIVLVPYESDGKLHYAVSSVPKVENNDSDKTNIYVVKKWDDDNNAAKKRPDEITVKLLDEKTTVDTAVLNEQNGWSYTFENLPENRNYSVVENPVSDYNVTYGGDATNGFVITNTYEGSRLPVTGQYWFPIVILAFVGVLFLILGIYELGAKKNDKKK